VSTTLDQDVITAVAAWRAVEADATRLCAAGAELTQAERVAAERVLATQAALIKALVAVLVAMRAERLIPDAP